MKKDRNILPIALGAILGATLIAVPAKAQSTSTYDQPTQQQDQARDRDNAQPLQQAPSTQLPQDQDRNQNSAVAGDRTTTPQADTPSYGDEDMQVAPQTDKDNMAVQPERPRDNMAVTPKDRDARGARDAQRTDRDHQDQTMQRTDRDNDAIATQRAERRDEAVNGTAGTHHHRRKRHHKKDEQKMNSEHHERRDSDRDQSNPR